MFVAHCQLPLIRLIILWMSIFAVNASKKVVLLDTANSPTELRWKTHSNMDEDEIGWLEETYRSSSGLENRRAYVVCNVEHPDVDNWLRTPRIERQGANRLHVETTFTMRDCSEFPGNARTCKETFRLYAAQVNGNEELPDVWEEDKWELIGRITADIGRHSTNDAAASAVNQDVHSFTVTKDVVYFAFRDSGACVSILNVKIFYEMCPEITRSFVRFPQTTTGAEAHSIIAVPGKCVSNASPLGVVKQPTYVCKATGSWDMLNGECVCNPGFVASVKHNTCTACALGTYKSVSGVGECRPCPPHSTSLDIGSFQCTCDTGYYRAIGESIEQECTQPPSKPSRLTVVSVDQTSARFEWGEPLSLGGRKEVWYRYKCLSCPSTVHAIPSKTTFKDRRLELSGLNAGTAYTVMVFAENLVSSISKTAEQYAVIEFTTRPLTPTIISDLRVDGIQDNGVTIAWKPPASIENLTKRIKRPVYEIEVRRNETFNVIETTHVYHTFQNLDESSPYSFKVRALTDHGWGEWSDPLWYQSGIGEFHPFSSTSGVFFITNDNSHSPEFISSVTFPPAWVLILLLCFLLVLSIAAFLVFTKRKGSRKNFSDCDGLDSYKNGTLTPDYHTPPPQNFVQSLFRGKLGAPLISYGTTHSSGYGNNRFKPYVDPTAYEDPNQALSEFVNDVDPSYIHITDIIGSGEFGEVCKGLLQSTTRNTHHDSSSLAQTVAIKTLKPGSSEKARSDFLMEASIMGQFEHPNVIRLIGVVTKSEPVMIVTEYMENGSLDQFLRRNDDGLLGIAQILDILRGIAAGMKYLTEKGYVHRDLAARNVLIDNKLVCKIADFGLSRGLEGSVEQEYTTNGGKIPVRWTAPEAITHRKFTAASDVWSFGVVMWEVCSFGERPYWEWTNQKVISEITLGYRLPAPMDTPPSLHSLMLKCWNIDRHRRPTFAQILMILEEYVRHPELVFAAGNVPSMSTPSGARMALSPGAVRRRDDPVPSPPNTLPPPVPLDDFLQRIGLSHCSARLHMAGITSIADLYRLSSVDLLSYGLIADEAQKIRDTLNRSYGILQRNLSRSQQFFSPSSPSPQRTNTLSHSHLAREPLTTSPRDGCNGFFV